MRGAAGGGGQVGVVADAGQREVGLVLWAMSIVVLFLGILVARSLAADDDVPVEEAVRAAAVIVALVPQGLAVMVTVSYAMAAVRMAGTGVLIQRMNAVESISHVNVLCLDKTGTLTTNRLIVEETKPFEGSEAAPFYSWQRGKHQLLPNGNLLVTETEHGRVFEAAPDGSLVWERDMGWDADRNMIVTEARRLPPDFFPDGPPACLVTAHLGAP